MTSTIYKLTAIIAGLFFINFQTVAASATTTVSANIVPLTSLFMSDNITLREKTDIYQNKTQTKLNGVNIETSLFNSNNSAKIKINSPNNKTYDISITPTSVLADRSANKMEFKTLRVLNNFDPSKNNKEQELVIEAVIKNNGAKESGLYIGTVEIIVNYN
jgi:hypothetical protein